MSIFLLRPAALALLIAIVLFGPIVAAQETVGSVFGQISPRAGLSLRLQNAETGFDREISADKNGRYDIKSLQAGEYTLSLLVNGETRSSQQLAVSPGVATHVDLMSADVTVALPETIVVVGSGISSIDVTNSQTSTNFTASELREIPVVRNPVSVAELTADAAPATGIFNGLPTFGGSSSAENAYYINGFDVTNLVDNLSFSELPFESIGSEQVFTGGYGPEYNRSTGGVISITTKHGSNQFDAGASVYWQPNFLQGRDPTVYLGTTTTQTTPLLGHSFYREAHDETEANIWLSGPVIKNRLFYYVLAKKTWTNDDAEGRGRDFSPGDATSGFQGAHSQEPFYLVKIDGAINEKNHLEFTYLNDNIRSNQYAFNESYTGPPGDKTQIGSYLGDTQTVTGGNLYTVKLESNITDALTYKLQWGQLLNKADAVQIAPDGSELTYNGVLGDLNQPGCPYVIDQTTNGAYNGNFVSSSCYAGDLSTPGSLSTRTNYRSELEYKFNFGHFHGFNYGAHDLTGGYEHDNFNTAGGGFSLAGGRLYAYEQRSPTDPIDPGQIFVEDEIYQSVASSRVIEQSYYMNDNWQIGDRVVLNLGVRNDAFDNRNTDDRTYVKQNNIWQPRLGAAWDVKGDSSMKVFANYGRYSLPITSGVGLAEASATLYELRTYFFTGVNPVTGVPTGLTPTPPSSADPEGIYHGEGYVIQNGSAPNPHSLADNTLKPIEQSEYIIGVQARVFDQWVATLRGVHRNLDRTIDNSCDGRPIQAAAAKLGFDIGNGSTDGSGPLPIGVAPCYLINPGRGAVLQEPINVNDPNQLYTLNLSAADIGEPKAKRVYDALEVELDRAWGKHFFFHGSYTWSHSYGNTEGLVKTAFQNSTPGVTADFDFPELEQGAYGSQANDHRHNLKLFGAYKPIPDILVGAGFMLRTGSPYSCYGTNPHGDPYGYGNSYHYCGGQLVPQGTAGYTDTITQLDLNFVYSPHQLRGLSFSLNVNNVFDEHGVESVNQFGESPSGAPQQGPNSGSNNIYAIPGAIGNGVPFQGPRTFRFGIRYEFNKPH